MQEGTRKHPMTPNGFKDATTDPLRIAELWSRVPDGNIGISTGKPSGIWVLDADGNEGITVVAELEEHFESVCRILPS